MRIHRVSMTGFGPFRATQSVDFDALGTDGLFLIHGRTGSGKTTLLDAVVYGLYGTAPRYSTQPGSQIRSQHCTPREPTVVEVEFTVGDERHRVRRSPDYERPKARGEGTTVERASAELSRWDGSQWVGLASQVRTVGQWLHELVPFNAEQFLQVVLLAQGDFQRFLVAPSKERQALLRTLFDSRRFDQYDAELQRRATELRQQLRAADEAASVSLESLARHSGLELPQDPDAAWTGAVLRAAGSARDEAEAAAEAARSALVRAQEEFDEQVRTRRRQLRLAGHRAELDRLELEREVEREERQRLSGALAARSVEPSHRALRTARTRAAHAGELRAKAESRFEESHGAPADDDVASMRDEVTTTLATLRQGLEAEREARTVAADLAAAEREDSRLSTVLEQLAALATELTAIVECDPVHDLEELGRRADGLRAAREAAARHRAAEERLGVALAAAVRAGELRTSASATLDALRRRRLDEYAGTLASALVVGEPCRVCGSVDHPRPATAPGDPVTDEAVEQAEHAHAEAAADAARCDQELAAARALAEQGRGGPPEAEVVAELTQVEALVLEAREEARRRAAAATELARLGTEREQAQVRKAGVAARVEHARSALVRLQALVEEARGEADSVAEREGVLRERLAVLDELTRARDEDGRAREAVQAAEEAHREMLVLQGFATGDEFTDALLPPHEVEALQDRVRRRDEAWTRARAGLADPDLQGLPEELVDPTLAHAAVEMARGAQERAVSAYGAAEQRLSTTAALVEQVHEAWVRSATERAAHERVQRLANSVHGELPNSRRLRLENYVLAVELEQILGAANQRLAVMSAGRYELRVSDEPATRGNTAGLDVRVLDQHTGDGRAPESLSGGERFLASLALALGMAEVVQHRSGGVNLDTLFIDEGFGSLDAETLDLVMQTLDELRANGRVVGIISHVETLKERIGTQVLVEQVPGGWSEVHVRT